MGTYPLPCIDVDLYSIVGSMQFFKPDLAYPDILQVEVQEAYKMIILSIHLSSLSRACFGQMKRACFGWLKRLCFRRLKSAWLLTCLWLSVWLVAWWSSEETETSAWVALAYWYLCHNLSTVGVQPDPAKLKAMKENTTIPHDVKVLRDLLVWSNIIVDCKGFHWYRRPFVPSSQVNIIILCVSKPIQTSV